MTFDRSCRKPGDVFRGAAIAGGALAIVLALGSGCDKSAAPAPTGHVTIAFDHQVSGAPLTLNSARYQNAAGNDYNVFDLRYYISGIELVRADGSAAGPEVFYRDAAIETTRNLVIEAPNGQYTALRFTFGVDAAHNHQGGLPGTVENSNMTWPALNGGGYHYMQLDGRFTDIGGQVAWLAHLGRLHRSTDPVPLDPGFQVEIPLTLQVAVDAWTLHVVMDVNAWFATPTQFDFTNLGRENEMENPAALQALHENGAHVFQIGTVVHDAP